MAAKTRASLMVEGELPEEGLAALDGDGGDVYLVLARRLAGNEAGVDGRAQSLEALFAEARRNEDEADELLIEGDWGEEPELPPQPIPFPVRRAPVESGALADLPLFASDSGAVVSAPASVTTNGKLVTLEELVLLVRRRKPRPKPVPEGQLALFGT